MLNPAEPTPPRPRTITGDLEVQVHVDATGRFCRQAVGGGYTACGREINHANRHAHRLEQYDRLLCTDGCFTSFEIELGRKKEE